jgi:hypothetical protein
MTILIKRGLRSNLTALAMGELAYCTDTNQLYIGTSTGINFQVTTQDIIGVLSTLKTSAKSTIVNALNEVKTTADLKANASDIGTLSNLRTNDKTTVINAINELANKAITLSNLQDVDVSNKVNGYAIQYDSASGKFKSLPLPSGSGSGATNMSGLSDVDVVSSPPTEGQVLQFSSGKWKPQPNAGGLLIEDWLEDTGELVNYIDISPPMEVTKVAITYMRQTSFTINWMDSASGDIQDYIIFNGSTQLGVVPATLRKVKPLSFAISGLTSATNYTITIKSRDIHGNVSTGAVFPVRTYGNKALHFSGGTTWEGIMTNTLTYDQVEFSYNMPAKMASRQLIDLRPAVSVTNVYFSSTSDISFSSAGQISQVFIDGALAPTLNDTTLFVGKPLSLNVKLNQSYTGQVTFGGSYYKWTSSSILGDAYECKIWNNGTLVARYNLTEQFAGTTVADASGNNNTAVLTGGSWVATTLS